MQRRLPGLWPQSLLGPPPGLKEINLLCWALFCLCIMAPACFFLVLQIKSGKYFYQDASVDFVYLYGVGQIAYTHPASEVYNYDEQLKTFNSIVPLHHGVYGPSPYPPFVPQFFRLFAKLPFAKAYLLWIVITLVLYTAGTMLLLREFFSDEPIKRWLILCLALSYYPFLRNTLVNGQMSAIAFFALVMAVIQERQGRLFLSGIALSVLLYKPPFLIFIVPMLLLTRRFKAFSGFVVGTGILVAIATLLGGITIWPTYFAFMRSFGHTSGLNGKTPMQLQKYIDLNAFSNAVPWGRSAAVLMVLALISAGSAIWLFIELWRLTPLDRPRTALAWAAAITWTMVVNIYFPIYDSILVTIVVVLTLAALRDLEWERDSQKFVLLAVLTLGISWFTEAIATRYGVQLLTFVLLALAVIETSLLHRLTRRESVARPKNAPAV